MPKHGSHKKGPYGGHHLEWARVLAKFTDKEGQENHILFDGKCVLWKARGSVRKLSRLEITKLEEHYQVRGPFGWRVIADPASAQEQEGLLISIITCVSMPMVRCHLQENDVVSKLRAGICVPQNGSSSDPDATGGKEGNEAFTMASGDPVEYLSKNLGVWFETSITVKDSRGVIVAAKPGVHISAAEAGARLRRKGAGGSAAKPVPPLDGDLQDYGPNEVGKLIALVTPLQHDLDIPVLVAAGKSKHTVFAWMLKALKWIKRGNEEKARKWVETAHTELEHDKVQITAAFNFFNKDTVGGMNDSELQAMLHYLGMPSEDTDRQAIKKLLDTDEDGDVSLFEFRRWVLMQGGTVRLFLKVCQNLKSSPDASEASVMEAAMRASGIDPSSLSFWSPTLPDSEKEAVVALTSDQQQAVAHIRHLSEKAHEAAMPKLLKRVADLNFTDVDLYETLDFIREKAACIVHLQLDKVIGDETLVDKLVTDTHYRNQFETHASGGLLDLGTRKQWEHDLFGDAYDNSEAFARPKYGVINIFKDPRGIQCASQYGDSYIELRDVRLRTTFAPEDSGGIDGERLACCDFFAHDLMEYSDKELTALIEVGSGKQEWRGSYVISDMRYKEAQYHGEVSLDRHVSRLVAASRHKENGSSPLQNQIEAACKKHGWELAWHDGFVKSGSMEFTLESKEDAEESFEENLGKMNADNRWTIMMRMKFTLTDAAGTVKEMKVDDMDELLESTLSGASYPVQVAVTW